MNTKQWKKKKRPDKKKTNFFCVFCKCLNSKKTIQDHSEELLGNNNNKKRFYWKNHWSQLSWHDKYGWWKAEDWQWLTVDQPLFAVL